MAGLPDHRDPSGDLTAAAALTEVVREHTGRLTAALVRALGDFSLAEDLVQDALLEALRRWPAEGVPERPEAWLMTVARNRGIDVLRRNARYRDKLAMLQWPVQPDPDDRLRLVFTCCHPALSRSAQVALTLRTICGLTTEQIAHAFMVPETTIAQRLTRAKRKISQAGIPYRVPGPDELGERLDEVLAVIYLMFNEGYLASSGDRPYDRDLTAEAEWLAALLHRLMPTEPEVAGLLSLIRLHKARTAARFDEDGRLVLLRDQDRSRWDHDAIKSATELLVRAAGHGRTGPYQLQAAIVACHAEAPRWADTDWRQILLLYDMLLRRRPSPVFRLHRAIALSHVAGPETALADVEALGDALDRYHLYHATRAALLRELGRVAEARDSDRRALELTANTAERVLLEQRLSGS
jgi:RNA polymerase sigma factor (sigma-70 family)